MRVHSKETIKMLKEFRKEGYSINELVERFSIPRTTIWHHVHNTPILSAYAPLLRAKRGGNTKRMQQRWESAQQRARELLQGKERDAAIAIAMLYWGEGSKKACEFINSNGEMIQCYLYVLRNLFSVPEASIQPTMRIFTGMDQAECVNYWTRITKIPAERFIVRLNDGGTRGKTQYGMCRITVKMGSNILKLIRSLIYQFSGELLRSKAD